MKIRRFSLQREYEITCKLFLPETAQVRLLRMPGADHRSKIPAK